MNWIRRWLDNRKIRAENDELRDNYEHLKGQFELLRQQRDHARQNADIIAKSRSYHSERAHAYELWAARIFPKLIEYKLELPPKEVITGEDEIEEARRKVG